MRSDPGNPLGSAGLHFRGDAPPLSHCERQIGGGRSCFDPWYSFDIFQQSLVEGADLFRAAIAARGEAHRHAQYLFRPETGFGCKQCDETSQKKARSGQEHDCHRELR